MGPHQQIGVDVDAQIASGIHWFKNECRELTVHYFVVNCADVD